MKKKEGSPAPPRANTERTLRKRAEAVAPRTPNDLQPAVHELQVHQIELEMQGEELRRIHADLDLSRERYFALYNLAPAGYFTLTHEGLITEANLTAAKLLGVARGSMVNQPLSHFVFPEDQDINYLEFRNLFETGVAREWEMRLVRAQGPPFWASVEAIKVQDADGAFAFNAIVSDIDERVLAREELLSAHRRNVAILESISDGFNAFDHNWQCTYVNPAAARMLGKTVGDLLGKHVRELWPQTPELPFDVREYYSELFHGWFEVRYYPSREGFSLFFTDITERRQVEEARQQTIRLLEATVREKTVMLQEIHHRVKNNLAVVSGLLSMKADATGSLEAKEALEASQKRLHSMALIHEHLYASLSLGHINFSDYARALAGWLYATFIDDAGRISLEMDVDPIEIGLELAVPCALILNELLSNAFKYAFPDRGTGTIRVSLHECAPGLLEFAVEDDGVGLPAGGLAPQNKKSIGLKIVGILTKQLDGSLEQQAVSAGTRIVLRFARVAALSARHG